MPRPTIARVNRLPVAGVLIFLAVGSLPAQVQTFVVDSGTDTVYRMVDIDGDGTIDPLLEVTTFYDDLSPGPDLSVPSHLIPYGDGLLLSDGGTIDTILLLRDLDQDGDANGPGEATVFYDDSSPGPNLGTPNGMALAADGSLLVSDDGAGVRAVLRMTDLDGDDAALSAGEVTTFYDDTALSPATTVTDPESIAIAPSGAVFVGDTTGNRIVRLEDLDGDGDALDIGEAVDFYASPALTDIDSLQVDATGAVYVINEDDGLVLVLVDGDGDGTAMGAGEVTTFLSGSAITDPNDALLVAPGELWFADGALDAVYIADDIDGDGTIQETTELFPYFDDGGALLGTPSGIAQRAGGSPPPAPVLTSVDPSSGPVAGGTSVDLFGSALGSTSAVTFGGLAASSVTVIDSGHVSAVTPAATAPGAVDVAVETAAGSAVLAGAYTYLAPGAGFLRGDADGSGGIDITDAVVVLDYLFTGGALACLDAADSNDDGAVDLSDPVYLLNYQFAGGAAPPPPFPATGDDPTPDPLGC